MDKQLSKQENSFLGSGWAFPVAFSWATAELEMSSFEENINDDIWILLHTKRGEHQMDQAFGSGLQQFMFRKMDETLKGEVIDTIKMTLLHYEPRIKVETVEVTFENIPDGLLSIAILYKYKETNSRHNYIFPYNLKEGTNL